MPTVSREEMARAEKALEKVRDAWLEKEGVTAIDLGFKWSSGKMTPRLAIRVHVARKKYIAELRPDQLFPEDVDGIPVDIIEGTYAPQALVNARPEAAVEGRGKRYEDIPIGVSVGCMYSTAGTLGAKVVDIESEEEMILSNWHVLVGRRNAQAGLAIWQPGWIDGGTKEENTIAHLSRWILGPFDAAVARLTGERKVLTSTLEGREVVDVTSPLLGMNVWKSGRSSGYTEGFIDGVMMQVPMDYREAGSHLLEEVFRIIPRPGSGPGEISIGGDSGAVWVDEESGKAVGLHFAGEVGDSPEHALAHDIGKVIDKLKVRFPDQVLTNQLDTPAPVERKAKEPADPAQLPGTKSLAPAKPISPPAGKDPRVATPVKEPSRGSVTLMPGQPTEPKRTNSPSSLAETLLAFIRNLLGL
jgi:hypothetical protein